MTDDQWLLSAIQEANSNERLAFLQQIIKHDTEQGAGYTQNEELMASYRDAWKSRKEQVRQEAVKRGKPQKADKGDRGGLPEDDPGRVSRQRRIL